MEQNRVEKIGSFRVDHMRLLPGIYISRIDNLNGGDVLVTYDIRLKRPNFEDPMTPEIAHTIEHLGATFLRNHPEHSSYIVYFGPMGCLTGMYLIYRWTSDQQPSMKTIASLILSMMKFIVVYSGNIPSVGFDPESCGNYSLNDIDGAKNVAANILTMDDAFGTLRFEYPNEDNSAGIETSTQIFGNDKINTVLAQCRKIRCDINIDYSQLQVEAQSDITNDVHNNISFNNKKASTSDEKELSLDEILKQINPMDIALFLKKNDESIYEEVIKKAFPSDVVQEEKQVQIPKKTIKPVVVKKKKTKPVYNTGDALF